MSHSQSSYHTASDKLSRLRYKQLVKKLRGKRTSQDNGSMTSSALQDQKREEDEELKNYVRSFRKKVERKFASSQINRTFVFPRPQISDSEESIESLEGVSEYDLAQQNLMNDDETEQLADFIFEVAKLEKPVLITHLRDPNSAIYVEFCRVFSKKLAADQQERVTMNSHLTSNRNDSFHMKNQQNPSETRSTKRPNTKSEIVQKMKANQKMSFTQQKPFGNLQNSGQYSHSTSSQIYKNQQFSTAQFGQLNQAPVYSQPQLDPPEQNRPEQGAQSQNTSQQNFGLNSMQQAKAQMSQTQGQQFQNMPANFMKTLNPPNPKAGHPQGKQNTTRLARPAQEQQPPQQAGSQSGHGYSAQIYAQQGNKFAGAPSISSKKSTLTSCTSNTFGTGGHTNSNSSQHSFKHSTHSKAPTSKSKASQRTNNSRYSEKAPQAQKFPMNNQFMSKLKKKSDQSMNSNYGQVYNLQKQTQQAAQPRPTRSPRPSNNQNIQITYNNLKTGTNVVQINNYMNDEGLSQPLMLKTQLLRKHSKSGKQPKPAPKHQKPPEKYDAKSLMMSLKSKLGKNLN